MTTADDANQFRLKQAEKILSLFADMHGRPARSIGELEQWASSPEGKRYLQSFHDKGGKIISD